jgi:Immunity protein 50
MEWFGRRPSFHDAEILSLSLDRTGTSCIRLYTWDLTSEIDAKGYYVLRNHVVVSFLLDDISDLELVGFNHQNVIFSLTVERSQDGFKLLLGPCYGLAGTLTARSIRVEFAPGKPAQTGISL